MHDIRSGSDLRAPGTALVVGYRDTCDANFSNCQDKEEDHLAPPHGLVRAARDATFVVNFGEDAFLDQDFKDVGN